MEVILITVIVTFTLTTLGSYFSYRWNINAQKEISDYQQQQIIFSKLMGKKILIKQLYVSRFEALVYSDYHEAKWKIEGNKKESINFQEAKRWMHKSEDFVIEITKANQDLFELLGLVMTLFPSTPELERLINQIYNYKVPKINADPFKMDMNELEKWKINSIRGLQLLVENEYDKPIHELLNYLSKQLEKETLLMRK